MNAQEFVVSITQDITDEQRINLQIKDIEARIDDIMEAIDTFDLSNNLDNLTRDELVSLGDIILFAFRYSLEQLRQQQEFHKNHEQSVRMVTLLDEPEMILTDLRMIQRRFSLILLRKFYRRIQNLLSNQ